MSNPQPGNFTITNGTSRTEDFIVYGPGGKNRPGGPDIDVTTVVDAAHLGLTGSGGTVSLVPTGDGSPSRKVRFDASPTATSGQVFGATVTARGKSSTQYGQTTPAPDLSAVEWVTESLSAEFPTPA